MGAYIFSIHDWLDFCVVGREAAARAPPPPLIGGWWNEKSQSMPAITSDLDNVTWYSGLRGTRKVVRSLVPTPQTGWVLNLPSPPDPSRHAGDRKAKHAPLTHVGRVSGISAIPLLGA